MRASGLALAACLWAPLAHAGLPDAPVTSPSTGVLQADGFCAKIPIENTTVTSRLGPDFTLYYVNVGEQTIAGFYEGFAPQDFLKNDEGVTTANETINGASAEVKTGGPKSDIAKQIVFRVVSSANEDEILAHAWYGHTPHEALSESILRSVKRRDGNKPCSAQ